MKQAFDRVIDCMVLLRQGALTEADLAGVLTALRNEATTEQPPNRYRQGLMYAAAATSDVFSPLLALSVITGGCRAEIDKDAAKWPYGNIADAIAGGWRIVRFPDFPVDNKVSWGLGCEFILEKWEDPSNAGA